MPETPVDIVEAFLSGALTAEAAATRLVPLLAAGAKLNLELGPDVVPLFQALDRLHGGTGDLPLPSAEPVDWSLDGWGGLEETVALFWETIQDQDLEHRPLCLTYGFTVGSATAAHALRDWITSHSDHSVTLKLPASFRHFHGWVAVHTQPRRLSPELLRDWVAWLASIPPIPDACPNGTGISDPPTVAG
jgi:hypothetical protein